MEKLKKNYKGFLFLITGNSSSGKDSIISGVIRKYSLKKPKLIQARRYVTRPTSETENNFSINVDEFDKLEKKGRFALSWRIYGLCYGVPIEIERFLEKGQSVIINVSRMIINEARDKYKNVKVVFIKVPLEITIFRLRDRGRETEELIQQRIFRAKTHQTLEDADLIVDNSGDLEDAINQLLSYIANIIEMS